MNNQPTADPRVWLVDDDQDDQLLIQSAFLKHATPIRLLTDGQELVPALEQASTLPRLILMDINMPYQNGFDTLQQLRQVEGWRQLPVIVFSTSAEPADHIRAFELGATGFLTKPSNYGQLMNLVEQLVLDWQLDFVDTAPTDGPYSRLKRPIPETQLPALSIDPMYNQVLLNQFSMKLYLLKQRVTNRVSASVLLSQAIQARINQSQGLVSQFKRKYFDTQ
ncbi:response regulator [Spirosoma soli]|uniref:Response regulator n=1 Tax=Spirosoma soli TaxID=1770529 RepID=A0ABW5LXR1_9BACT